MGLVVTTHPDMKDAVELVQLQIETIIAHTRIRNWKHRLQGTIITSVDDQPPIMCRQDIIEAVRKAVNNTRLASRSDFDRSWDLQ